MPDLLTEGEALCILATDTGLTREGARQVLRKKARQYDGGNGLSDCYEVSEVARVAEPYRVKPELAAAGVDTDRGSKLDAERVSWEFKSKSARRLDAGKRSIEDSPIFGGDRQESLF